MVVAVALYSLLLRVWIVHLWGVEDEVVTAVEAVSLQVLDC